MKKFLYITPFTGLFFILFIGCTYGGRDDFGSDDDMRTEDAPVIMDLQLTNLGYFDPEYQYAVEVSFSYTDPNDDVLGGIIECDINEGAAIYELEVCEPYVDTDCHYISHYSSSSIAFELGYFTKGLAYSIGVTLIDMAGNESNTLTGKVVVDDV